MFFLFLKMAFRNIIVFNLFWNYLWIPKGNVLTHECISHDYLVSSVNNNGSFSIQEIRYNCSLFDQQTIAFVTNPSLKNKDMYLLCNYVCTVYTMQRGTLIFFGWNWEENSKYDLTFGQLGQIMYMKNSGYWSFFNFFEAAQHIFSRKTNLHECFKNQ